MPSRARWWALGGALVAALSCGCTLPRAEEPIELHFRGLGLPPLSNADRAALLYEELDLDEEPSSQSVAIEYQNAHTIWESRMRHAEEHAPTLGPGPDVPVEARRRLDREGEQDPPAGDVLEP